MRTRRLKAHPDASSGFYHCMSRVVDRQFIFGEIEKEHFARLMRQYAHFCGIQILTFCLMGNHFHLLIEVSKLSPGGSKPATCGRFKTSQSEVWFS